jgi:hypothetical protein
MKPSPTDPRNATFVDENRNVIKGEKALELIKSRTLETIDPEKGVTKVDANRWQEAQRYERRTWMEGIASLSDRNEDHENHFGGYRTLKGKYFASAVELGCGPFTNLRRILTHCVIGEIHLLDPLANDYLAHPFCRYKKKMLGGVVKTSLIPWSKRGGFKHPLRFYKHKLEEWKIGRLNGRPVTLHASGIEDFHPQQTYGLCVMINVIEHCRDVEQIFSRILEMTNTGSYFVFADKLYNASKETEVASYKFDAGHPLRVDYSVVRGFLTKYFDGVWDAEVVEIEDGESFKSNYFIGIRKPHA